MRQSSLLSTITLYCCCHFYCTLVAVFTASLLPSFMYPFLPISLYLSFPITRNYVVLNPLGQSPTVCTMPDDFIHYAAYRPTTVREMARLQSFDDSFVFQGKRQTGGNNRQLEIPQYTLVGNAVPPLMARAIANTILKNIK